MTTRQQSVSIGRDVQQPPSDSPFAQVYRAHACPAKRQTPHAAGFADRRAVPDVSGGTAPFVSYNCSDAVIPAVSGRSA